ncbi:glycoside hydrolase family 16 protein [Auriscalpium vulgare]|uniref:Glycoside hydrolase family 16 protein n=1 Tax=Auriscalpium vulgare TaxID=40419 RepID=A0ACB8RRC9_9AGAM|nr:glycoside hydrolase family 16 protein [Auriscalpium vulgare]
MHLFYVSAYVSLFVYAVAGRYTSRTAGNCMPLHTNFSPGSVASRSSAPGSSPFIAVSPEGSYSTTDGGLKLFLQRPSGKITTDGGVNDKVAEGATINSTFTMLYGKLTVEVSGSTVSGIVSAAILIAEEHDEIDVELVGGDQTNWQTNVYAPSPSDKEPLWGVFGEIENLPARGSIADMHQYTIDWSAERIVWSVDGRVVRTLRPEDTRKNGTLHYPSHPSRVQLGIWDASSPQGTAEWANGPVNWERAPERMSAVVRSVTVECP